MLGDEITKYFRNFVSWAVKLLSYKMKPPDGMESTDTTVAGVPVRVYKPFKGAGNSSLPGLVYYHGGGWTFGTIGKNSLHVILVPSFLISSLSLIS